MKIRYILSAAVALTLGGQAAHAVVLDLTTAGSSGTVNGGFFKQVPDQSTGTGVIQPFVRIQANEQEEGYNTDLSPMPDVKTGTWTHDILLSAIPTKVVNGVNSYEFLLDINQNSGGSNELLTLNELEIYTKIGALTTANTYAALTGNATLRYDLDGAGDSSIEMNYALNSGSGSGDMFAYIPVSLFPAATSNTYLYLYSKFGPTPNGSNDGFEEWAVVGTPTQSVPDGGLTVALLGLAMAGLSVFNARMKSKA